MFAYRYHFSNGETISIDVSDDWGEILIDLDRQEYNNDHKETRRHYSLVPIYNASATVNKKSDSKRKSQ